MPLARWFRWILPALAPLACLATLAANAPTASAADIAIDASPAGRLQIIDGFGTCHGNPWAGEKWYQAAYYDDLGASIVRMDLTPRFQSPYGDLHYYSPWFMGGGNKSPFNIEDKSNPNGPENNRARTYTNATDYSRPFGGKKAPIAVMGKDIAKNIKLFDFKSVAPLSSLIKAGESRKAKLGDFKLYGSIWSPAPWVKIANGQVWEGGGWPQPTKGTPFPFIWGGNFAGGKVDVSGTPLEVFNDGSGPTSALTQFARSTAAYIKGLQDAFGVRFYAISIQNEINFPEFYNSCVYRTSAEYIAALKGVRQEFDKYPDLKPIRIVGPEDLLGGDVWSLWQYGGGETATTKNLQYLYDIAQDPEATKAIAFACIHGYAPDGATAAGADSKQWRLWADGWTTPPAQGLPANIEGFTGYDMKSWMTETSGESNDWLAPKTGFPGNGAWSIAFKTQQALTAGRQSAIIYWQFAEKADATTASCLTQRDGLANQPKYVAAKHFYKFIRPGAVALKTTSDDPDGITASAYWHETDKMLTVVLVNRSPDPRPATIHIPPEAGAIETMDVFTSSEGAYWKKSNAKIDAASTTIQVPGYGVVTAVAGRQ